MATIQKEKKLTPKQEMFCLEYIVDMNATQAAIRAGYSVKTASRIASENLYKPDVQARVSELKVARTERVEIDADYVLSRLVEIDQMDVKDIMTDEGSLKKIREWPSAWRRYISGLDLAELFEGSGDERISVGVMKKIKWPDKVKNLEMLGKHTAIQAWRENLDLSNRDGSLRPSPTIDPTKLSQSAIKELLKAQVIEEPS